MNKKYEELIKETWADTHNTKLNIYLTKEDKKLLDTIKKTHQLSYSTIIDILCSYYYQQDYTKQLMCIDSNMYKTTQVKKTTIKIKNIYELNAKTINNALQIYLRKLDKNPNDPNFYIKTRNHLNHLFQDTYDPFYNYNNYIRMQNRYERETKK